jgi:hypothetical protein
MQFITSPSIWHAPDSTAEEFFWSFIHARQNAWLTRHIDRQTPFSSDPIIRGYHFTNVYRETDRHTQFAVWEILENHERVGIWHATLHCLVYRLFGSIETYRCIQELLDGAAIGDYDHIEALANMLVALQNRRGFRVVAPGSQMLCTKGTHGIPPEIWLKGLTDIFLLLPKFIERVMNGTLQECYELLLTICGFGPKKAYNTVLDFSYPLKRINNTMLGRHFDKRAWVLIHGNSLQGLALMGVKGNDYALQRAVRSLADKSDSMFPNYLQLRTHDGSTVGLGAYNIIKCLEEWNLYHCVSEGRNNTRQFKERTATDWSAPMLTLPAYGTWNTGTGI